MASPQIENGYTKIANELIEALVGFNMSGQGFQVTLFMIRKTYGFNKIEDFISLSQIMEATGMSKIRASQVVNRLQLMKILTVTQNINGIGKKYKINKDFETWVTVNEKCNRYTKVKQTVKVLRNRPLRKNVTTKETITKENIKKDIVRFNSDNFEKFYSEYPVHTGKAPTLEKWKKKLKDGTLPELNILLEAIVRQRAWRENTTEFRPAWRNPAAWLHQEGWIDETTSYGGVNGTFRKFTSEKPISRQDREQADEAERINREYREAKAREATGQAT